MDRFYNIFRIRLILLGVAALLAILLSIHAVVYSATKNIIVEQLGSGSQGTAVAISEYIMKDIDEYKEFLGNRDIHSDYYRRMQEYLASIKEASSIRYIYTERQIDSETVEFILDAEPIGSEDYSPPGSTTELDAAASAVYQTALPATLPLTESPYGTLMGGCAPIFDTNGDILGLTGVNMDASVVIGQLNRLQTMLFLIYIFTVVMVILLLGKYAGTILEPMLKDKLTGAYSKRYMEKWMQAEVKTAVKTGADLAIMMCDLDLFNNVNDTYGHTFGDVVLASVSSTIMTILRKTDYFFRYGGEEFVVMLTKADVDTSLQIAERIRAAVEHKEVFNRTAGANVKVTISIGIAHLSVTGDLIEAADKALYDAKKTRNRVSLFKAN